MQLRGFWTACLLVMVDLFLSNFFNPENQCCGEKYRVCTCFVSLFLFVFGDSYGYCLLWICTHVLSKSDFKINVRWGKKQVFDKTRCKQANHLVGHCVRTVVEPQRQPVNRVGSLK